MLSDRCCTLTRMKSASTIDSDGPITAFTRRRFDAVRHMPDLLLQCHHTACSCEPLDAFTWCRRVTGNILWPDSVNCRPLNLIHAGPVVVRLMCRRMSSAVNLLRSTFCCQPSAVNLLPSTATILDTTPHPYQRRATSTLTPPHLRPTSMVW